MKSKSLNLLLDENPDIEYDDPVLDFAKSIKLYQEIITLFPESEVADGALYMYGWCHSIGGWSQAK